MMTYTENTTIRIEVYKDSDKKYRWRFISKAQIMAASSQAYVSKQGCINALKRVQSAISRAETVDI